MRITNDMLHRFHPDEQFNFSLKNLNSWYIGGTAERFFYPTSVEHLKEYLSCLPTGSPVTWLGLGSNLLIRDGGVEGAVILTRKLSTLKQLKQNQVFAAAGVTCAKFARFCVMHGYSDAAFFAGIPGTIGGALRMNAGAFGGQTWDHVSRLLLIDQNGYDFQREPTDYCVGYRSVNGSNFQIQNEGFIGAIFDFSYRPKLNAKEDIKKLLQQRGESQPIGTRNCGSVFKNPKDDHAARLIEVSGLKGYRIQDIGISEKHANFIINYDNGTANQVESLIELIQQKVLQDSGIVLQPEVHIIGKSL